MTWSKLSQTSASCEPWGGVLQIHQSQQCSRRWVLSAFQDIPSEETWRKTSLGSTSELRVFFFSHFLILHVSQWGYYVQAGEHEQLRQAGRFRTPLNDGWGKLVRNWSSTCSYLHVQWSSRCIACIHDHLSTSFMLCLFRSPPVRWGSLDLVSAVVWATGVSALCQASGLCVAPALLPMHQAMRVCWNSMNFARAIARISFRIHVRTYDIYIYICNMNMGQN